MVCCEKGENRTKQEEGCVKYQILYIVKYYEILSWEGWVEERAGEAGWVSGRGHLHPHRPSKQGKQDDDDNDDGDGRYTSLSTQLKRLLVGSTLKAVSVCIRMIFSASLIPYLKPLSIVRSVISEYLGHFLSVSLDETWYWASQRSKTNLCKRKTRSRLLINSWCL